MIQFCTFRELLEKGKSKKIIGFDAFGEFPRTEELDSDKAFIHDWNKQFQEEFLSKEDIEKSLQGKGIGNIELVKGNILETLDQYLERYPFTRIALLHIDTDVYEPAKYGLEKLFERVVKGGAIVFDDYATVEGETLAIDEFFKDKDYEFRKYPFSHTKPSYIIKH